MTIWATVDKDFTLNLWLSLGAQPECDADGFWDAPPHVPMTRIRRTPSTPWSDSALYDGLEPGPKGIRKFTLTEAK